MAKPPTGLTQLLYETGGTPERIIDLLDRSRCLSAVALESPAAAVAEVARMLEEHARAQSTREAGWTGPNWTDVLASMLIKSPLLNERGRKLDRVPGLICVGNGLVTSLSSPNMTSSLSGRWPRQSPTTVETAVKW